VFCFNDTLAVGAMMKAFEAGLRIPKDIAIVGSGNFHYSGKLRVPLSSVDQCAVEIGVRTAKLIASLIEKPEPKKRPRTVILEPSLAARESSVR
jgi:LacI family transcriptional regulator